MDRHSDRDVRLRRLWLELNDERDSAKQGEDSGSVHSEMRASEAEELTYRRFLETATMMERFQVAGPTDDQTRAVLARLAQEHRRAQEDERIHSPERFADQLLYTQAVPTSIRSRMLRTILSQTTLFSPWFWFVSALVIMAGAVFMPFSYGEDFNSFILMLSLVSGASVFYALRSYGQPMAVLEATFPMHPAEVAVGRFCIILLYDIVLAFAASFGLFGVGLTGPLAPFIVSWLVPLCLCASLAFFVILRFGLRIGAILSVAVWASQLLMGEMLGPFYVMSGIGYAYWGMSRWLGAGLTVIIGVAGYYLIRDRSKGDEGRAAYDGTA